jgi:hypothetical protein
MNDPLALELAYRDFLSAPSEALALKVIELREEAGFYDAVSHMDEQTKAALVRELMREVST